MKPRRTPCRCWRRRWRCLEGRLPGREKRQRSDSGLGWRRWRGLEGFVQIGRGVVGWGMVEFLLLVREASLATPKCLKLTKEHVEEVTAWRRGLGRCADGKGRHHQLGSLKRAKKVRGIFQGGLKSGGRGGEHLARGGLGRHRIVNSLLCPPDGEIGGILHVPAAPALPDAQVLALLVLFVLLHNL